ncbi:MAG: TonB-dependent receptor [Alphaproteobacteria bacterium]|nr:TonB-dependent receptor [Alphaproteobacteria bacterium]
MSALTLAGAAFAQNPPAADDSEEIVVTAQKREQKLQDVPVAVSAFTAKTLENQATISLLNLSAKAPNVILQPVGYSPFASMFYIRGLGFQDVESSFEPSVGTEVNGVYLTRNSGALMDFFDIESVEILRGPQGTLYGRNTIGGLVSVRTKRPDGAFNGNAQVTVGDHGRKEGRFGMNFPISDTLSGRISLLYKKYDGYNYNVTQDRDEGFQETVAGRATFHWQPTEKFDATLILDRDHEHGSGASMRNAGLPGNSFTSLSPTDGPAYHTYGDVPIFSRVKTWGATLEMNYDVGIGTVTSVTGYRKFDDHLTSDYDAGASSLAFFHGERIQSHHQFSEELRIASNGDGRLNYVFGVYFLDQSYKISNDQNAKLFIPGLGSIWIINDAQRASQDNTAVAVFGQLDYNVTEKLIVTVGGRYSYEEKDFTNDPLDPVNPFTGNKLPIVTDADKAAYLERSFKDDWTKFTPKVGISYKFNDDVMAYAQWQQGLRSGGFNGRANTQSAVGPFGTETVDAYEIGLKTTLADGKLRFNLAAFRNDYSDVQTGTQGEIRDATGAVIGFQSIVVNAASQRIDGVELEANWSVSDDFTVNFNAGWLDARYTDYIADLTSDGVANPTDNTDLPLPFAPKWSGSLGATWSHDFQFGTITVNGNAVYMDDVYTSSGTINRTSDVFIRKANTLFDATITYESPDQMWRVSLWGKNLADKLYINNTFGLGALGNLRIYAPPMTWGLDVGVSF